MACGWSMNTKGCVCRHGSVGWKLLASRTLPFSAVGVPRFQERISARGRGPRMAAVRRAAVARAVHAERLVQGQRVAVAVVEAGQLRARSAAPRRSRPCRESSARRGTTSAARWPKSRRRSARPPARPDPKAESGRRASRAVRRPCGRSSAPGHAAFVGRRVVQVDPRRASRASGLGGRLRFAEAEVVVAAQVDRIAVGPRIEQMLAVGRAPVAPPHLLACRNERVAVGEFDADDVAELDLRPRGAWPGMFGAPWLDLGGRGFGRAGRGRGRSVRSRRRDARPSRRSGRRRRCRPTYRRRSWPSAAAGSAGSAVLAAFRQR